MSTSSSQDQELVGHLPIELSFLLCKFLSREGCSLEFSPTGARFLEDGLVVPGRYTALSNDKKMVTILHRELERKVEKVKHMKLEVMQPKTKNNTNFQPEETITDQSTLIVNFFVKSKDWVEGGRGGGGLIERVYLLTFLL